MVSRNVTDSVMCGTDAAHVTQRHPSLQAYITPIIHLHLPPPALTHTLFEYCLNLNSHVIVNWDTDCKDAISDMLIVVTGPTRPVTRRCSPREDLLPTEARP